MRLVKGLPSVLFLALLSSALLAFAGCGGGGDDTVADDDDDDDDDVMIDPTGTHTQYVVDSINMPTTATEAQSLGLNLDGDPQSRPDNALGQILSTLATQGDINLQESVDLNVNQGDIIILFDIQATALTTATGVGARTFLGSDPSTTPCADENDTVCRGHFNGSTMFGISEDSPTDAVIIGSIVGGKFTGGPGEVTLQISIVDGQDPLTVSLIGARTEVNVTADGLMSGKLGGAVTEDDLNEEVLPGVLDLITGQMDEDCPNPTPPCCTADSTGETLVDLFDQEPEGGDCMITLDELKNNDLISSLLAPDVDLLDETGAFNPRVDGVKDSLSLGVGYTGVGAEFVLP